MWMEAKPVYWSASAVYQSLCPKGCFFNSTLTWLFIWEKCDADMHCERLKFYMDVGLNWDLDVDGRIILRWIFRKWEGVETGWSWLRIGTDGRHLWIRWWTFGFHKVRGISWLAAEPVSFSRRTLLHGVSKIELLPVIQSVILSCVIVCICS